MPSKEMFESINYYTNDTKDRPYVLMGDEETQVPVEGHGVINYVFHGRRIRQYALYVPKMGGTGLLSAKQHMSSKGCYLHLEAGNCELAFPNFTITPTIDNEIEILVRYGTDTQEEIAFDETTAEPSELTTYTKLQAKTTSTACQDHP